MTEGERMPNEIERSHSIAIEDDEFVNRAQALHDALAEMDCYPAIRLGKVPRIVFELDERTRPGAIDLAKVVLGMFDEDDQFRDDFITAVANIGNLYVDTPGINVELKTCGAANVLKACTAACVAPLLVEYGDEVGLQLVWQFDHRGDRDLSAPELMALVETRYSMEPGFRNELQQHLFSEGPNLIFQS